MAIRSAKNYFFSETLPHLLTTNPKKFWNVINVRKPKEIVLKTDAGFPVPRELCSTAFNNAFSLSFSDTLINTSPPARAFTFPDMEPISIDVDGVYNLIKKAKLSSLAGVDNVNYKFLKSTVAYSSAFLSYIFTQSLQSSTLPDDWKMAKVIPVHKSGDIHNPLNYRPISLTFIPCKLLEHIIYCNLISFLELITFLRHSSMVFVKIILVRLNY